MRITIIFFLTAALLSCGAPTPGPERSNGYSEKPKTAVDSLLQDVMDAHDATMAKMGKLTGAKKELQRFGDSLSNVKGRAEKMAVVKTLATQLRQAEKNMDDWMEQFNMDSAENNVSRRLDYLRAEKIKVTKVKEEVLSSLARADSIMRK